MRTIPAVGKIIEDKTFNSVDFPAPLGPIIPTNSPSSTVNEILSNTSVLLFKRPYVLLTWFTSTIFHFLAPTFCYYSYFTKKNLNEHRFILQYRSVVKNNWHFVNKSANNYYLIIVIFSVDFSNLAKIFAVLIWTKNFFTQKFAQSFSSFVFIFFKTAQAQYIVFV